MTYLNIPAFDCLIEGSVYETEVPKNQSLLPSLFTKVYRYWDQYYSRQWRAIGTSTLWIFAWTHTQQLAPLSTFMKKQSIKWVMQTDGSDAW